MFRSIFSLVSNAWSTIKRLAEKINRFLEEMENLTLTVLGIGVIVGTVCIALYIPTKLFAVIVTSVGSCAGASILAVAQRKRAKEADNNLLEENRKLKEQLRTQQQQYQDRLQRAEEQNRKLNERLEQQERQFQDRLRERERELNELHQERERLLGQIARLEAMRINVNAYRPVLRLGLCELDMETFDVKEELIERVDRPFPDPRRSEERWYLGIIHYKFKALFGVDLGKLRFKELGPDKLEISGLESELQGVEPEIDEPFLAEVRTYYRAEPWQYIPLDMMPWDAVAVESNNRIRGPNKYDEYVQKQRSEFLNRLNKGLEFPSLNESVVRLGKEFLRVIFAPLGKEIVFVEGVNESGVGFDEYLEYRNRLLDKQIRELREKLREKECAVRLT
jgi:hypothetical protein